MREGRWGRVLPEGQVVSGPKLASEQEKEIDGSAPPPPFILPPGQQGKRVLIRVTSPYIWKGTAFTPNLGDASLHICEMLSALVRKRLYQDELVPEWQQG